MAHRMVSCRDPACALRVPAPARRVPDRCPACGGAVAVDGPHEALHAPTAPPPRRRVAGLLDNVRSVTNVGAMLRTADAAGLVHVHLCGLTAPGDHPDVDKTALGAQRAVAWSHHRNAPDRVRRLRAGGWLIWALEAAPTAVDLDRAVAALDEPGALRDDAGLVVVVGHEVAGVDPAVLDLADRLVRIPMRGTKESLNVATAFGIAAWAVTSG